MSTLIHELVRRHTLSPAQALRLWQCAHPVPANWPQLLQRALLLVAALLLGAGLIFWVAAHWPTQTRSFKLTLLQVAVFLPGAFALVLPRARNALLLLALLALGGLLAFVGQTYQTGADAWQLFAAWGVLACAWVLLARSDGLWALWLLIAGTGLALWSGDVLLNPLAGIFQRTPHHVTLLAAWLPIWIWPWLLPHLRMCAVDKAPISQVVAALMALAAWTGEGIWGIFWSEEPGLYAAACALVALALFLAWRQRALAVLTLALLSANTLFLAGCGRLLFRIAGMEPILALYGMVFLIAASIGLSVRCLHRLHKAARWAAR